MTIRTQIFAGCLSLMALTAMLGGYAYWTERELGTLATTLYDDAFMGMSYLRSAQVGFAVSVREGAAAASLAPATLADVAEDLAVARDRAMSPAGGAQAEDLRQRLARLAETYPGATGPVEIVQIRAAFEKAVETFAADGFRYRRSVGQLVEQQVRRGLMVLAASLAAAILICAALSRAIARPVRQAVAVAQSIAAGRLDNPIRLDGSGETADLLRALDTMQSSIAAGMARIRGLMDEQAELHAGELATKHAQMEAAVDNMNQGLCLLDQEGRLQVTNRRFGEMFGETTPGLPLEAALASRGLEAMLSGTAGRDTVDFTCDLADGRVVAISQRKVQSGGWVATYDDISERRASEIRLAHMARHDLLTGLPNRLMLSEHLPLALERSARTTPLAAVCIDLDRFKSVNDTLGHAAGDVVLGVVAERIRRCTGGRDFVVRLGGDEFAILQENAPQPDSVSTLARHLTEALAEPIDVDGQQVIIGCSLGIALSGDRLTNAETLLKSADLALYRAKAAGRGSFRFFEPEMDDQVQARRALDLDLRRAVRESEFEAFYQPLVDTTAGGVTGFEALMRWRHPTRGMISPGLFIPAAEESGLIGEMGAWVLRQACSDAAQWPGLLKVAVNLSPTQFRCRPVVDDVERALAWSGLRPERLELEITESLLLQDDEAVLATLHALRRLGVRISMDDFGTGYSSLNYLRRFPFDKIKIDQSFVRGMTKQADCLAIVQAVIGLARSLGIAVLAEGVETEEQLRMLREEGCGEVQGYLFSRPRPVREVPAMLIRRPTLTPTPRPAPTHPLPHLAPADS